MNILKIPKLLIHAWIQNTENKCHAILHYILPLNMPFFKNMYNQNAFTLFCPWDGLPLLQTLNIKRKLDLGSFYLVLSYEAL